jgi:hypothetical protein
VVELEILTVAALYAASFVSPPNGVADGFRDWLTTCWRSGGIDRVKEAYGQDKAEKSISRLEWFAATAGWALSTFRRGG